MTVFRDVWCDAVERTWVERGPAGLSVRTIQGYANVEASNMGLTLPSRKTIIYDLVDPQGEKVFGGRDELIEVAHDRAKSDLLGLVQAVTAPVEPVTVYYPNAMHYCRILTARPALRRMMATLTGPAGRDTDLDDLASMMARWLAVRGGKTSLAMLHGIAEAMANNTLPKTHQPEAVRRAVMERS